MRCSQCGTDNSPQNNFCAHCGNILSRVCEKCGAANPTTSNFCGKCGAPLMAPQPLSTVDGEPIRTQAPSAERGERRHLTVLFCDLVGSTEIASRLDPEEWRETVAAYHHAAAEAVTHYGGHVAKYLGDGVMAYFGWPAAHDNDAERAARAGLAMLDAIAKLNEQSGTGFSLSSYPKLTVRVGIDSGAVVVGVGAGKEADVFGEAPNIAARVQTAAEPGTILITHAVHQLISGLFVVESRAASVLKGIERPLQLYKIVEPSGVRGRLEAAAAVRGLTPFVGREDELRSLMTRWERSREGEGQIVLVIGEAGIGKSRLLQRFHEIIPDAPQAWLEAAAAPFFQNTPFHAISELLRQLTALSSQSPLPRSSPRGRVREGVQTGTQLAELESALVLAGLKPAEAVPLIAPLLNLPASAKYPPAPIPPEHQRRRLFAMLVEWILSAARAQPLVIVIEDLHWADASTLEVVELLAEQGPTAHLLLLCSARPEFRPQWPLRAHYTQITLNRLSARNVREMIAQVAARNALAGETVDTVIERTGGVPLFVEELTRAVLESDDAKPAGREIPATLHDSLMARLDRLGPAKEVVQIGAVIGSEFSYQLLRAVHSLSDEDLQHKLRRLTDADLLYVRGLAPDATYQFKHALIHDAAYEALLKSRRRELHRLVARTIDEKFPGIKEAHPEVLARHWTEAGETERAVAEWSRAGKAAEARQAFIEAQESFQQALTLLNLLPESRERDGRELQLRQSLVSMLTMTRGHRAPETLAAYQRVGLLAEKSGNLQRLRASMMTRFAQAGQRGDLSAAAALADQALELARREGNPTAMAYVHMAQLIARHLRGDLAGAENHFAAGLKFVDDPVFRKDPYSGAIMFLGWASLNSWILGRADVARERLAKTRPAVRPANPLDLQMTRAFAAYLHTLMREYESAEALAARSLDRARSLNRYEKYRFANDSLNWRCALGYARAQLGRAAEGIALIRQGIDAMLQIENRVMVPTYMTYLAAAQDRAGAVGDALETVEQALTFNPEKTVGCPETLRIRGELRLKQGNRQLAEADFRDSIAMARSMGAKAWELRTTMSLARLLTEQGHRDEARTMLAEIYNWFTEGFDTADLKEAKVLLDELSRRCSA
jgi:class 3 adenylate cyclase/tetratricopeptide (TPR) repeat protein